MRWFLRVERGEARNLQPVTKGPSMSRCRTGLTKLRKKQQTRRGLVCSMGGIALSETKSLNRANFKSLVCHGSVGNLGLCLSKLAALEGRHHGQEGTRVRQVGRCPPQH